ncbi:hypothetical protein JCM6882_005638 [Rhodosporidiobolus microsporus]
MTATSEHRVLSRDPLNSEPTPSTLIATFITPPSLSYNRNHGAFVSPPTPYSLSISSEVPAVDLDAKQFSLEALKADFGRDDVIAALVCAGNRRNEMNEEKETEGLQWGGTALANVEVGGALLRDVLAQCGITLEKLEATGFADKLHLHFETTQHCSEGDEDYFGVSLPVKLALDPSRPVVLAYDQSGAPLQEAHGAPLRLLVPGVIGARSVKWLERVILRVHESDSFFQKRDYKVLPPEATPETKQEYLKQTAPLMEYPLNSEICEPSPGAVLSLSASGAKSTITVKGYALGANGIPISRVSLALVPLPLSSPPPSSPSHSSSSPPLPNEHLHHLRLAASALPPSRWCSAALTSCVEGGDPFAAEETGGEGEDEGKGGKRNWGWTLWSAEVEVPEEVGKMVELAVGGGEGVEVALVCYTEDKNGQKQELETPYNLRGVGEASWSVIEVRLVKGVEKAS